MDALSSIFTWMSEHEAVISAAAGITVLARILFADLEGMTAPAHFTENRDKPTDIGPEEDSGFPCALVME